MAAQGLASQVGVAPVEHGSVSNLAFFPYSSLLLPTNTRQSGEGVPPYRVGVPIAPVPSDAFIPQCARVRRCGGPALMETRRCASSRAPSLPTGAGSATVATIGRSENRE